MASSILPRTNMNIVKYISMLIFAFMLNMFLAEVFDLGFWGRLFPSVLFCSIYGIIFNRACSSR